MKKLASKQFLTNILGVVYVHKKTPDGGDIYITEFAQPSQKQLKIKNWYEKTWFNKHRVRLTGTSSVYRVPTRKVRGNSLDLVVKNCRVGEDVPLDTHTLEEFRNSEFNSPWEEFSLVVEMREGRYGPQGKRIMTQRPLAIYVPPEKMQPWQSGRSKSKINRIRAQHPGIDLDILKQYKLVYEWIRGKNLIEVFEQTDLPIEEIAEYLKAMQNMAHEENLKLIEAEEPAKQVEILYQLLNEGVYSIVDYELVFRTPEHEDKVKYERRHSYLDYQKERYESTPLPAHLSYEEIFGVPYIFGHTESTGGHLWVVGKNAHLFDYFLPERWRKTPSLSLSETNEVVYTVTKDNIHLVWKTSRVGEIPADKYTPKEIEKIKKHGINSPFEAFAISHELNERGIHSVYVRAIYMTGSAKLERSQDLRKFRSHKRTLDSKGSPVLQKGHNYITIRGYYNGPDEWVPEHEDRLLTPIDLSRAASEGVIDKAQSRHLLRKVIKRLKEAGYDGSLLKVNDILLTLDNKGEIVNDSSGEPDVIICNFEIIWRMDDSG
jgi:hypothetical protein